MGNNLKDHEWVLLLYQIPAKSDTERVRLWRALQKIGAVMVKNSVAAFPDTTFFRKATLEIANEITFAGGEAILTKGQFLFGLETKSLTQTYNAQVDAEYKALAKEISESTKDLPSISSPSLAMKWEHKLTKFHSRMNNLEKRTISLVDGKERCKTSLAAFAKKMSGATGANISKKLSPATIKPGSTWVTRKNLHVDRLASAWLIKNHIDPKAKFQFVNMDRYAHKPGNIRFDVFKGEFGHVGDKCTFEVLVDSFKIRAPSICALAEVIHDLDIRDQKYDRKETEGIRMALDGIIGAYQDDQERLSAAMNLLDSLILSFKKEKKK